MKKITQVLLVVLLAFNVYLVYEITELKNELNTLSPSVNTTTEVTNAVTDFDTNVTRVVETVENKVVSIMTYKMNAMLGSGSGVVYDVSEAGTYIITNHHVIEGAQDVVVKFANGEEVDATVVGSDVYTDLALLYIEEYEGFEAISIGDSSLVDVGEFVLAMGSPLGIEFSNSSTFGIISGTDRIVPVDLDGDGSTDWDMVVLQTDAAINPGNSGGALVNMNGELIGINSLKIADSTVEGMGFSIPVNEVIPIITQLKEEGKVSYPVIGISAVAVEDLNGFYKLQYGIGDEQGVLIVSVISDSPAEKALLQENDVITRFDGREVSSFNEFRRALYAKRPGDTIVLEIVRAGETHSIEVTLN